MESMFRISSASVSDRGLSEKRPQNEDSYLEMGQCGIFAVADGVGGAQAGEVASQMAMEILAEAFTNFPPGADAESVMRTAIDRANSAIYEMAHELPQLSSMATTFVALHLAGNIATIGHVGDSRLYRLDRDGNLHRETDDHSMVAEEVRAGRMTEEQAENHPSRNIISRALGAEPDVEPDLKTMMIEPGSAFLICSDGITRHVADQEIKGVLTFGGFPNEICEYLKGLCYERGAEDNLTAVVVKVSTSMGTAPTLPTPSFDTIEIDEPTVATARPSFEETLANEDDQLLELETSELKMPKTEENEASETDLGAETISFTDDESLAKTKPALDLEAEPEFAPEPDLVPKPVSESVSITVPEPPKQEAVDSFSMFGDSGESKVEVERSGSFGRILGMFAMLILGSAIGLGVYHFAVVPRLAAPEGQNLSVMKTEDIAFSSFEKNRRNVDADPAAYLKEVPPPEDAEDYYLIGRANILTGDFPKARLALIEAQKRISTAEQANAKILNTDIATALIITNDPTIQNRLKIELDASSKPANSNANTNANR